MDIDSGFRPRSDDADEGVNRAFLALYLRHERALARYCQRLLGHEDDARDLFQTVALRAMLAFRGGERPREERAWLRSIAHNAAASLMRRRRRTVPLEEDLLGATSEPITAVLERERLAELTDDVLALTPQAREILLMREFGGLSRETIAGRLRISPGAVSQSLTQSRAALRADRAGRGMSCAVIRELLMSGDRRRHRARLVRAHMRACAACRSWAGPRAPGRQE